MKHLLVALLLCSSTFLSAQSIITVELDRKGTDKYFETSRLIAPVFRLKGDSIESYYGFGIESSEPLNTYKVVLPKFTQINDTGYTFLFSNLDASHKGEYTAVLVANYGRMRLPAILYVDRNRNYDFTDDGSPDTFYSNLNHIDIALYTPDNPKRQVLYRLSRFSFTKDLAFKKMADEMIRKHQGNKLYAGTDFSFREQRFNLKTANIVVQGDSFSVTLRDANYNGLYNEAGVDEILINPYTEETLSHEHTFPIRKKDDTYFERNFKSYKVVFLDSLGSSIRFQYDPDTRARRQLIEGKKVPRVSFLDVHGKKVKLKWYRRKPVYVYFWNRESEGFEEDTAALRMIQEKFCPMIKVIALNYGDNPKSLPSFVKYNGITYLNGVATYSIIKEFQVEEVPYGFLMKKRLRLYKKGLRPAEVLEMLERGEIQSW